MKIFLNIEADSPAELDAAIAGLAAKIDGAKDAGAAMVALKADVKEPVAEPPTEKKPRAKKGETAPAETKEPEKAKDLTDDEVKNYVIDYLNDVTKAEPSDPEARVKALHKVIKHITGGELMKLTDLIAGNKDKWPAIMAFVDERRAELKSATAENVEE